MSDIDITEILRAIAKSKKSSLGDYWSLSWCNNGADEIDRLRQRSMSIAEAFDKKASELEEKIERMELQGHHPSAEHYMAKDLRKTAEEYRKVKIYE